ncbi:tumor necrosis factor receptor superfamily member 16-like isoform X4 [Acropora millepora]|uniref:tumor necrosis factor receptor superfamily member 16-like isoform X4 n=1 Tax=Acropora millepora TaxID=45264 RepID=UPI001CF2B6BB|nr:tumor necrosis factor receptor superfamily member 16-like isoform X4 [Acropora millepora]XP_044163673.1 tumor necrosis factor receptor superfamily member 16-like isoform X4 [Acropora millepora]
MWISLLIVAFLWSLSLQVRDTEANEKSVYAVTCPKGTSRTGYGTCKPCENGHFSDTVNSTKCFKCHHCRRQEIETEPCTPTHNIICTCAPGYYFNSEILFCFKCRLCGPGRGVIKNCTFNSDTVCAPCEKGKTYSDIRDFSSCKSCTNCGGNLLKKCTRKNDTVCGRGRERNTSKTPPRSLPVPRPRPPTTTPPIISSTLHSETSKPPVTQSMTKNQLIPFEASLYVLSSILVCAIVAFAVVMYRYKKRRSQTLESPEIAAEATASTNVTTHENHYTTVLASGSRREHQDYGPPSWPRCSHVLSQLPGQEAGSKRMLREVPYTLITELAMCLNPREKWKTLGGHLEFNNTEISNFALVKENATQIMLEEWGQRDCATVSNLMKIFTALKWSREEKICAAYV